MIDPKTKKIKQRPVLLVGSEYWNGMVDWINEVMLIQNGNISSDDMNLFKVVDTVDEVIKEIDDFYKDESHELKPNF